MRYDLNVPWTATSSMPELQRTISFLSELGYDTIALNHTISDSIPAQIVNPMPTTFPFPLPPKTVILRRCTVHVADPSTNHRLPQLAAAFDILAIRPTVGHGRDQADKGFLAACGSLTEHSIISLDLTIRYPFYFKPKPLMTAVNRGIFFEISYGQATLSDSNARRNFISNTMALIRGTKGRGLILSSEARNVLGIRAPADVINLMSVWGLGNERGLEAMGVNPRGVVVNEGMKRSAFRGIIDAIDGGESLVPKPKIPEKAETEKGKNLVVGNGKKGKRKGEDTNGTPDQEGTPQISKRAAKKARLQALKDAKGLSSSPLASPSSTPEIITGPIAKTPSKLKAKANG